tara:strand:- start:11 stop:136 length:126 start_codon:yes stop_codon:yes gene_type:complete
MTDDDAAVWLWLRKSLFGDGFAWESTDALEELVDCMMEMIA